jgi:hypothetical protein
MLTIEVPTTTAAAAAQAFVRAVVEYDPDTLADLLTDDVWLRALLPRGAVEHHDRAGALASLHGWFGRAVELRDETAYHRSSGGRELVGWRVRLRPDWAPDVWHLIEQIGYVRVADGRIRRVDLVCTGFQPEPAPDGRAPQAT